MMKTCSPRVRVTLARSLDVRQAWLRRRHIEKPPQARPASSEAHVEGSGTAIGLARRKPRTTNSLDGSIELLPEADTLRALPFQPPPRRPRDEPAAPVRSFHSETFPLMSNVSYGLGPPLVPTVVRLPVRLFQTAPLSKFAKLPVLPADPVPRIVARLRTARPLTILEPVGNACRVEPAHEVHRLLAHVGLRGVLAAVRRAARETDSTPGVAVHVGVVDGVGICARCVYRVEELHVLRVRPLELHDLERVGHG